MNNFRNRIAQRLCNFVLDHIANRQYATFVSGSIQYGLRRAAEDAGELDKYDGFWAPTDEKKYKMFQKFLTKDESIILTNSNGMIYFITEEKMDSQSIQFEEG